MARQTDLADLLGVRVIEGVRWVDRACRGSLRDALADRTGIGDPSVLSDPVLLAIVDGEPCAFFSRWPGVLSVARIGDDDWGWSDPEIRDVIVEAVTGRPIACNLIRRPAEATVASVAICALDESTGLIVLEIEAPPRRLTASAFILPLDSVAPIPRGVTTRVTARPSIASFRPERLIIGGTPTDWIVRDIRIGNRSQFNYSGDIPGEIFAASSIVQFVQFETVRVTMDLSIDVSYVGKGSYVERGPGCYVERGDRFIAAMLGRGSDDKPMIRARWTPEGRVAPWMIAEATTSPDPLAFDERIAPSTGAAAALTVTPFTTTDARDPW